MSGLVSNLKRKSLSKLKSRSNLKESTSDDAWRWPKQLHLDDLKEIKGMKGDSILGLTYYLSSKYGPISQQPHVLVEGIDS